MSSASGFELSEKFKENVCREQILCQYKVKGSTLSVTTWKYRQRIDSVDDESA